LKLKDMPKKHKVVNGKSCDGELLKMGQRLTQTAALSLDGARSIWEHALDGNKVTEREKNSIRNIMSTARHGLEEEARQFFEYWLKEQTVSKIKGAKCLKVDGVKCDSAMVQIADHFRARLKTGGAITIRGAEAIWFSALDGKGLTNVEKETLRVIIRKYKFEAAGKAYLESKMAWLGVVVDAIEAGAGSRLPDAETVILSRRDALALTGLAPPTQSAPPLPPPDCTPPAASAVTSAVVALPRSALQKSQLSWISRGVSLAFSAIKALGSVFSRKRKAESEHTLSLMDQEVEATEHPAKHSRTKRNKINLNRLREVFDTCDNNKDGKIDKRELIKACRSCSDVAQFFELPMSIRQEDGSRDVFESFFQAVDVDGDRAISWVELLAFYQHTLAEF